MKVEIVTLLLFIVIFLTDAMEATNEDINSPLVSYLLAKLQRLEAKMMVRPNIRNTRQTTDKPAKAPIVADNKQCKCPPSVVIYIRWGNSTCPYGADVIYSEVVAGSWWEHEGAAVDHCVYLLTHNIYNINQDIKDMQDSMEQSMKYTVPIH